MTCIETVGIDIAIHTVMTLHQMSGASSSYPVTEHPFLLLSYNHVIEFTTGIGNILIIQST